jgi:DNA-binding NtrC family response regulator
VLFAVKDKATADRFSTRFDEEKVKVFSTSHSHQAVKFLQNQKFHCLITHMDIAKGHGENIVKEVRGDRNNQNYRIPIIVVLNDYDTKGLLTRIQPLINHILDEDVKGPEVYSAFAKLCHPYFLAKKKPS